MRDSTWNIDAVAPAFPPDTAFFADCRNICLADGGCFADAAIVSAFAGSLDNTTEETTIAAVVMKILRDDSTSSSAKMLLSGCSSFSISTMAGSAGRRDDPREEHVLNCDGRTNASEIAI